MDEELSVHEALGSDFFPESTPEPEPVKRRRGRPRKDEVRPAPGDVQTSTHEPEAVTPARTPDQVRRDADRMARELQDQVNEFVANWLADHGVDPEQIWKNPRRRKEVNASIYSDNVQPLMLQENTAKAFAKVVVRLDEMTKGKIEKAKNSPLGIILTAAVALGTGAPYLKRLAGMFAQSLHQAAPPSEHAPDGGNEPVVNDTIPPSETFKQFG